MNKSVDPVTFSSKIKRIAFQKNIPIYGSFEITHRCCFDCVHCFLGPVKATQEIIDNELSTDEIFKIIDDIVDAGCLKFLITGGEPLLRPDFKDVYVYAKKKGLILTLFTNGMLIDEDMADFLKEWPPDTIEISLYGACDETYKKVTGVDGAYTKIVDTLKLLKERNLHVNLKTVIMTINSDEYFQLMELSKNLGYKFRPDAGVFPKLDGDNSPLQYRVPAKEAAEKELTDEIRAEEWETQINNNEGLNFHADGFLYACGAGVTDFHIDPYGKLMPCMLVRHIKRDLRTHKFIECMDDIRKKIKKKKISLDFKCASCDNQASCGYCPGRFLLENGNEQTCSTYYCELGMYRKQIITGGLCV
ncbi:MAG: radical SAM protein [Kiritimatiellae bacterium]|jgi:MoaA/NifB/PqqE/SkfB family radical SAM enzyme|nr:radical SAM protein [Kiritimatiellia bacterium]